MRHSVARRLRAFEGCDNSPHAACLQVGLYCRRKESESLKNSGHDVILDCADVSRAVENVRSNCHIPHAREKEDGIGAGSPEAMRSLAHVEQEHIQLVLAACAGNISRAAKVLGLHRRSLQRKLARIHSGVPVGSEHSI